MTLPEATEPHVAMVRAAVSSANSVSGTLLAKQAINVRCNIRAMIELTPAIDAALMEMADACGMLEAALRLDFPVSASPAIDRARASALHAIGALERDLEAAKPSQEAIALGLGW